MWETAEIRQILLITDGCSNQGEDPVEVARMGKRLAIPVHVIGMLHSRGSLSAGEREVEEIARASGGLCRKVEVRALAETLQMVTQQSMQMTLQQVVNRELRSLLGREIHELPPHQRGEVARLLQRAGEEAFLRLVLLLDISASMQGKLPQVREAIQDLALSLQARAGRFEMAILTYPGPHGQAVTPVCGFQAEPDWQGLMQGLSARGNTPTGPALREAFALFFPALSREGDLPPSNQKEGGEPGVFSAYLA